MRQRVRQIADAFVEHNLLTYAAAIAFQGLIALVPLTLLALGFLGATGRKRLWKDELAPTLQERLTGPVFRGIDYTVKRILDHGTAGHGEGFGRHGSGSLSIAITASSNGR